MSIALSLDEAHRRDDESIFDLHHWCDRNRTKKTFASMDALRPCMTKLCVAGISTILEPSASASATAAFAGLGDTAFGAPTASYRGCTRCRGLFCARWGVDIKCQALTSMHHQVLVVENIQDVMCDSGPHNKSQWHALIPSLQLTFAIWMPSVHVSTFKLAFSAIQMMKLCFRSRQTQQLTNISRGSK